MALETTDEPKIASRERHNIWALGVAWGFAEAIFHLMETHNTNGLKADFSMLAVILLPFIFGDLIRSRPRD